MKRVVAERGVGILLVEHDMALVMDVCDEIYVMDFGTRIFAGTPDEVRRSDVVRAAYLGTERASSRRRGHVKRRGRRPLRQHREE